MTKPTTEELDIAQFGRVLHGRPSLEEQVASAEGAMQEMMAVSEKADREIEGYRAAIAEIAALASRNGPSDPIEALNKIADRAAAALRE